MKKINITLILLFSSYIVKAQNDFEKHISIDSSTAFWNIVKIKTNKDILVFGNNDWDYQCSFMLDSNGNMKWSHKFFHTNYSLKYLHDFTFTDDEGFMLTGGIPDSTGKLALALLRFDSIGSLKWIRRYHFYRPDWGVCILPRANGKFTVCATTSKSYPLATLNAVHFLIIDSLGNILKSKRIGNDSMRLNPTSMKAIGNNFIIEGECNRYNPLPWGCFLMKLDNLGNVLETKFVNASNSYKERGLVITHDNKILFAFGDGYTDYDLMQLDENLNVIWCKKIQPTGIRLDLPYISESPDSNYLMLGARWSSNSTIGLGCKIDTAGNFISGFQTNYLFGSYGVKISSYANKILVSALATQGGQLSEEMFFTTDLNLNASCLTSSIAFSTVPSSVTATLINVGDFANYLPIYEDSIYVADTTLNYFIEDLCSPNVINEITSDSEIHLFPNPTNSTLYINSDKNEHIAIINLFGEIMIEKSASANIKGKIELDVSSLSSGIYFIKIGSEVRKFVKE